MVLDIRPTREVEGAAKYVLRPLLNQAIPEAADIIGRLLRRELRILPELIIVSFIENDVSSIIRKCEAVRAEWVCVRQKVRDQLLFARR
jgi:hypothetical protein